MTTGQTRAIRPYRKRVAGTIKFAGLRVSPFCADTVIRFAESAGLSHGAMIAAILEDWAKRRRRK